MIKCTQPTEENCQDFDPQELDIAHDELKMALMFADCSFVAYSHGKLQRAIDARSKARSLIARAAARLAAAQLRERIMN
jgi:hypothetical protein